MSFEAIFCPGGALQEGSLAEGVKNTLTIFALNNFIIFPLSYWKLLQIGEPFTSILDEKLEEFNKERFGVRRVEVRKFPQKNIMKVSYLLYINLIRKIPEGRLTRSEDIVGFISKKIRGRIRRIYTKHRSYDVEEFP